MDQSHQFQPDPNPSVDDISDFLEGISISAPNREPLMYGASYGYSPPATDYSSPRFPLGAQPAHPPPTPTPRYRTYTATSASTSPSMTFDVGSCSSSNFSGRSYPDSNPTTAPSIGTVMPGNGDYILPCEFIGYGSCNEQFYPVEVDRWMDHIMVDHLQNDLPSKSNCWFCDSISFDARRNHTDKATSFRNRLEHICTHIRDDGRGVDDIRADFHLLEHLWKRRLISRNVYEVARGWREGPSHVEGIVPHDFIPLEQIQREELSQRVVVSEPRERERSHRSHRHHHKSREDTGHHHKSRKSSAK